MDKHKELHGARKKITVAGRSYEVNEVFRLLQSEPETRGEPLSEKTSKKSPQKWYNTE